MRWRAQERTYLLYSIVLALAVASSVMLGYERFGATAGVIAGAAMLIAGAAWYPLVLRSHRRRAAVARP